MARQWIKIAIVGAGVAMAAAGLFLLGRVTAGDGGGAGYASGVRDGMAAGRREGRALQAPTDARGAFDRGYAAGANDVFAGYDGGWSLSTPYVVTLARGGDSITYRIDSRTPLRNGVDYYLCPHSHTICQQPRR
jgi:hypothetical protein